MRIPILVVIIALLALQVLAAQTGDRDPSTAAVPEWMRRADAGPLETPDRLKNLPDPFQPPESMVERTLVPPTSVPPIERLSLSQLRLVAVVRTGEGALALAEDTSGQGFLVREGDTIGKAGGRVLSIERDRLVVSAQGVDFRGRSKETRVEMTLRPGR